jgi:cytochrome d ubiquinol oxidase subunit II
MLIFRAVAIEFRSKEKMLWWRKTWDIAFSVSSILIAFLMGVALGNIITGVPIGSDKEFIGTFFNLINPYTILVGVTTVALFMMHGTIYASMKTEGELNLKLKSWVNNTIIFFVISYTTVTMATLIYFPHMTRHFVSYPVFFLLAVLNMLAIAKYSREKFNEVKNSLPFCHQEQQYSLY